MKLFSARILLACLLTLAVSASVQAQSEGEQYGQLGTPPEPEIAPGPAPAPLMLEHGGSMDNAISVMGIFSYFYSGGGFGLGARYQKTILRDGFLPPSSKIQDDFGIEGNFEFRIYSNLFADWDYTQFELLAGAVWNIWFTPTFAVYPKLGFGVAFGSLSGGGGIEPTGYGGFTAFGAAGVLWQVSPHFTVRGEVGSDSIQAGVAFTFF